MLVLTCERDTVIDIGANVMLRVVSIGEETVELEIDAPDDIHVEPNVIPFEQAVRGLSPDHLVLASL